MRTVKNTDSTNCFMELGLTAKRLAPRCYSDPFFAHTVRQAGRILLREIATAAASAHGGGSSSSGGANGTGGCKKIKFPDVP
jgi:hypothetical protein